MTRRATQTKTSGKEFGYVHKDAFLEKPWCYTKEERDKVVKDLDAKGWFVPDEHFPDDKEKRKYLSRTSLTFTDTNSFEETLDARRQGNRGHGL